MDRNSQANPKLIAELYGEYLQLNKEVNSIRQERNENASSMKVLACAAVVAAVLSQPALAMQCP